MNITTPTVGVYQAALLDYMLRTNESGLAHAYDLGRSGLDAGFRLLHILDIHEKALGIILDSTDLDENIRWQMDASAKFLNEVLSPFEMALDGYRQLLKSR